MNNTYIGNEPFVVNGMKESVTINDFWRWAYSDLTNNINRSVLAEFIVASALDLVHVGCELCRDLWRPFDLLYNNNYRIEVKSSGYVQSHSPKHPDHIVFGIAPAKVPEQQEIIKQILRRKGTVTYIYSVYIQQCRKTKIHLTSICGILRSSYENS